ncbi:MAG: S41 family peptidase [Gemmatimonadetes bacterium]|nr:S41 family peptidase [Gemmatimonadota bacterium]
MKVRRSVLAPAAVVALAMLTGGWFLQRGVRQEQNVYLQVRLLQEVVSHIADKYVKEIRPGELYDLAIEGLIRGLGDPNTSFLSADEWENLRIRTEGEYGGLGIEIGERNGWITVITPLPGTPAERAGLRAGDRIVDVSGQSTEGWSTEKAAQVLRGPRGTAVEIKIERLGFEEAIPFRLVRDQIHVRSVPFYSEAAPGIGYVPLRQFSETSAEELDAALTALKKRGMHGIILDLRDNPGGLLESGVAVTDLFLGREFPVVETRGRIPSANQVLRTSRPDAYAGMPIVVLVNGASASASEIVAGALQDHDRALLVGSTSFGKGSVQTLFPLSGGHVLKLTTGLWYTPVGRSIQVPVEAERRPPVEEGGTFSVSGDLVSRVDTAGREHFKTMSGRLVYGGGGITPDLIVYLDTLTQDEETAVRELNRMGSRFWETLFNFTVRYVQENPNLPPEFRVTDAVRRELFAALQKAGGQVTQDVVDRASRYLDYHLEAMIASQRAGAEGEFRHTARHDRQLQDAIELLQRANSPEALFAIAAQRTGRPAGGVDAAPGAAAAEASRRP